MTLRQPVRQAISSGSTIYATVESYNLGLATVRLGSTGSRLTNLSTMGGEVSVGEKVIVDYSAGVIPVVRPMFTEPEEIEELPDYVLAMPEAAGVAAVEGEETEDPPPTWDGTYPDVGCFVHHEMGYYLEDLYYGWQILYPYTPLILYWGSNEVGWPAPDVWDMHYAAEWTTPGMVNMSSLLGSPYVTIPVTGKYILIAYWNDFISTLTSSPWSGHYRIRMIKNDTEILGVMTGHSLMGYDGAPGMNLTKIASLEQGDIISLELYHTFDRPEYQLDMWGHYDNITRCMMVQLIPYTTSEA